MIGHVLARFWSVGAQVTDLGAGTLTHRPGLSDEPTATFLHAVRAADRAGLDDLLARAAGVVGTPVRRVLLDEATPPWVEAELVVRDWTTEATPQLVLPAGATLPAGTHGVRAATADDWTGLATLFRADHEEEDRKFGRPVRPRERTDAVVAARRALAAPVRYLVAARDGEIAGFVAGWPGDDDGGEGNDGAGGRTGLIEDLYVRDEHRGHGVAAALLHAALEHARAGGAGPVVIGAEPDDTPKHLYARLGFVPTAMVRALTAPPEVSAARG